MPVVFQFFHGLSLNELFLCYHFLHLAPVVQNMDSTVHWINLGNQLRRDLSRSLSAFLTTGDRMLTFLEKVIILIKACNAVL